MSILPETLKSLYSGDISRICTILNKTVYITDLKDTEHSLFHTGFSFLTHKRTKMFVYYQLGTDTLVRSTESKNAVYGKIPQLIGLLCSVGNDGYVKNFSLDSLIAQIDVYDDKWYSNEIANAELEVLQKSLDLRTQDGLTYSHTEFLLMDGEKEVCKFPLYTECKELIFYNTHSFEEYKPFRYESETPSISTEEWYREEFGDDAETAWWNTH